MDRSSIGSWDLGGYKWQNEKSYVGRTRSSVIQQPQMTLNAEEGLQDVEIRLTESKSNALVFCYTILLWSAKDV